jgi:predicted transcriptional regulator
MTVLTLSDSDLMFLLTLLRSSERPMSTSELVQTLKDRARS